MLGSNLLSVATATAGLLISAVAAADVDPIVIKGSKFFYKTNGTEFYMRGIAYQQDFQGNGSTSTVGGGNTYTDPLADPDACKRDIPNLIALRTNTIRTYAIDPTKDHSQCMQMLQDAGIYVVTDLSAPDSSINRELPTWEASLYARYTGVIDEMAKYNNVLGFFAGNEVTNAANNTAAAPFVKAAVRDMKAYIVQKKYRPMGVGYATSDGDKIREDLADYFNCGQKEDGVDFWGYNIYSWCGSDSSYQVSGYSDRTKFFQNYSVPVFFAEYGCNDPQPREFDDVPVLFGKQMSPVWSGGIIFMYFQEENNFGLVSIKGNTASKLPDFTKLSSQIAKATPSGTSMGSYNPTNTQLRSCPPTGASWNASSKLPPSPNEQLCSCMAQAAECVPKKGLSDDDAGDLFGQVCGARKGVCDGINADGSTGKYGAYSMCSSTERLTWALSQYYNSTEGSNKNTACDWDGKASKVSPKSLSNTCSGLLAEAGTDGTSTVTSQPSGTGAAATGTSTAKKTGAAAALTVPRFESGILQLGSYLAVAVLTGAGMILL
ncbi:MAG: hypothetical protein M4579_006805 [Chaenotheca gracillima]|nr:MAG: hypothetical protein M4579_006805 [Chaenotheca gracillima]